MRAELQTAATQARREHRAGPPRRAGPAAPAPRAEEALESRLGGPWADETVFVVDEHAPLTTLESVGRDTTTRIARLKSSCCRRSRSSRRSTVVSKPSRRVTSIGPSWSWIASSARCRSTRTRPRVCGRRSTGSPSSRSRAARRVREGGEAAYDAGEYARCLEMLEWVAEHAAPAAEPAEAARLRQRRRSRARARAGRGGRAPARRIARRANRPGECASAPRRRGGPPNQPRPAWTRHGSGSWRRRSSPRPEPRSRQKRMRGRAVFRRGATALRASGGGGP